MLLKGVVPLERTTVVGPDQEEDERGPAHEYASRDEATEAILALTEADYTKLMLIARIHWKQRNLRDMMRPEELLSEAILRTIAPAQRTRRWRKTVVSLLKHLDRTMESISGHAVGDATTEAEALDTLFAEEVDSKTLAPRRFHRAIAENRMLAREQLEELEQSLVGAPRALAFLRLKAEGFTESEIMTRLGIDKQAYEAARKKAEREVAKYALRLERETES
jgi:hypothetical protein